MPTLKARSLREFRQSCRIKVRIRSIEAAVRLKFAHQYDDALNESPIGDRVFLEPGGWFDTDEVEFLEVLSWNNISSAITAAIEARNGGGGFRFSFELGGNTYVLQAQKTSIIDLSKPMIQLLTGESQPSLQVRSPTAEDEFDSRARDLIVSNKKFFTSLRATWNMPIMLWSVSGRE
jgi:hypothetical protein